LLNDLILLVPDLLFPSEAPIIHFFEEFVECLVFAAHHDFLRLCDFGLEPRLDILWVLHRLQVSQLQLKLLPLLLLVCEYLLVTLVDR
jgi:hypothetical protein